MVGGECGWFHVVEGGWLEWLISHSRQHLKQLGDGCEKTYC